MFKFLKEEIDNSEKSAERIAYLEQKYGITFPDILRQLYSKLTSCDMKMCEFEISGHHFAVTGIVPLEGEDIEFEYITDDDRDEPMCNYIPSDWYPLAEYGDNYYYWSSNSHQVYFVDHEDVEKQVSISDSIEAFIELLNNSIVEE